MELIYIDELLKNLSLNMPKLEVLIPNAKLYKTMLLQPVGEIIADNYFVRNGNQDLACQKFRNFFELASLENVELAVTPEYSCPWSVLEETISNDIYPSEKNIWTVGMESIMQEEFLEFISRNSNIYWIYEEELFKSICTDKFLDPVCYIFNTCSKIDDTLKKVAVVQFKTNPMAGTEFERDNLLVGNKIYTISNDENSINLTTIICSDALEFEMTNFNIYKPYFLIHIQLNKEPFNSSFSNYRENYYKINKECNKDILTLNWARKTTLVGNELLFGGSALYTKCLKVNLSDDRINKNHKKGLYYTYWNTVYTNAFYLNYDEAIFLFENTKVSQASSSPPNQNGSTGPKMKSIFKWNSKWIEKENANDCFSDLCTDVGIDFSYINSLNLQPINIERLILLSVGLISEQEHIKPKNLKSFRIESNTDEAIKRYTFAQHPNAESKKFRNEGLMKFGKLVNTILNKSSNFPRNIKDLYGNYEINYNANDINNSYYFNIYSKDKKTPATVVYLGLETDSNVKKIFDKIGSLLKDSQSEYRLVIWYDSISGSKKYFKNTKPKITKSSALKKDSFRKGE